MERLQPIPGQARVNYLTPEVVFDSVKQFRKSRWLHSKLPAVTDIRADTRQLQAIRDNIRGYRVLGGNLRVSIKPGHLPEVRGHIKRPYGDKLGEAISETMRPIDRHFRDWAGIGQAATTRARVAFAGGVYPHSRQAEHFDGVPRPQVVYKLYLGDQEYAPEYYPGVHVLRHPFWLSNLVAFKPAWSRPMNLEEHQPPVLLPANTICLEPWDAMHSQTYRPEAVGQRRAILAAAYDLNRNLGS